MPPKSPFSFGSGFPDQEDQGQQQQQPQGSVGQGVTNPPPASNQMSPEFLHALVGYLQAIGQHSGQHFQPAQGSLGTNPGGSMTTNRQTGDIGLDWLKGNQDSGFQQSAVGGNPNYDPQARLNSMQQARSFGIFQHPTAQVGGPEIPDQTINPQARVFNGNQLSQFEQGHRMAPGSLPYNTQISPFGYGFRNS